MSHPTEAEPATTAPAADNAAGAVGDIKPAEPTVAAADPQWPMLAADHPLAQFATELPELVKEADYAEIYGIDLGSSGTDFHKKIILQKFLRANAGDLSKAQDQLLGALKWRKEFQPLKAKDETFSKTRFGGLGYVATLKEPSSGTIKNIVTFNIYGAVKDNKAAFGDLDGFLRWRVALMEIGIEALNLPAASKAIPDYGKGPDPYQGIQVHDYLQVSFLRQDPLQKAAARAAIDIFSKHYPETLSRKFFVNVPVVMGWMFAGMKLLLSKETIEKFTVLSYGNQLHKDLGDLIPAEYGGKGEPLEGHAQQPKLGD